MGIGKVIIKQLAKVAKDSGKLEKGIDQVKDKVISRGLELVEESGIDSSQLPVNIPQYLRGESASSPDFSTPDNICAMPSLTAQQAENTIRLINQSQIEVEKIYETTNNIKGSLLSIQTPINTLSNFVTPIESTVTAIDASVKIIKLIPIPTSVPPGIGLPTSILTTFSSVLDGLDKLLSIAKADVKMIPPTLKVMTNLINGTITKLNRLENVIDPFLQTLTFIKATAELRPNCPDVIQEDIDNIKNGLLNSIQGNLASAQEFSNPFSISDADLEEQLHENSDPGFTYKNFKFVLEYEPNNEFFFPSRRIRCTRTNSTGYADGISGGGSVQIFNINPSTNPYLEEGAYSFGSLRILVEEAKFAVDTYTSNITLWVNSQVKENVSGSSDSMVDISRYTEDEIIEFENYYGFIPSPTNQALPSYIRYGNYRVNLNSSPTDIEYGADRLVSDGRYEYGSGIDISSYIQSGTIQVNKPVNIKMKTFGGTGDPANFYATGFTEALLTIKRSAAIQDDINPFTGRVKGFDQSAIDDFVEEYGKWSIDFLDMLYETFNETTLELTGDLANLTFLERLEYVKDEWFVIDRTWQERQAENPGLSGVMESLYSKTDQLLYNEDIEWFSWKLYGGDWKLKSSVHGEQTNEYRNIVKKNKIHKKQVNWYQTAKRNNWHVNNDTTNIWNAKAATLSMFYEFGTNILAKYQELYGARTDYNNGAWVGAASTLPIIPTQVGSNNEDITISLQETQLVNRNQTINEIVGSLSLLGTYTYDLEIIDSLPAAGGSEMNYPTNYTEFYIETT